MPLTRLIACCLVSTILWTGCATAQAQESLNAREREFFEAKIRPVLVKHCYKCHAADSDELKGNLAVDTAAGLRSGGDSGPALLPGRPDESPLIEALRYDGLEMPPDGRLPAEIVRDFEKWVSMGAPDPRAGTAPHVAPQPGIDVDAGRKFWAFQPVHDHRPPPGDGSGTTSIDAFVSARRQGAGLSAPPSATRSVLIRRLYFDLIGLPPTQEDLDVLLDEAAEDGLERLIDRLLQSPQFGVQWGRHWLDVARYADSNGGDFNATFHDAWRYRDYVVDSMNRDKPFDRFVREQIAGDLLPSANDAQRTEQLVATGFLMLGTKMLSERDKDKLTMDVVDEQINSVGSAFLGLTLGCARCHDHKFDPIPTEDYYALAGIFRSTRTLEGESQKYVSTWHKTPLPASADHVAAWKDFDAANKKLEKQVAAAKKQLTELEAQSSYDPALVVDDADARLVGKWTHSTNTPTFVGKGYIHDNRTGKGRKAAQFTWTPPNSGTYEVRVSYTSGGTRARAVPITVRHADGESNVTLDQRRKPPFDEKFAAIGRYRFVKQEPAGVHISTEGTEGFVIVDAVLFVALDPQGKLIPPNKQPDGHGARLKQQRQRVTGLEKKLKALKKDAPPPLPRAFAVGDHSEVGDCELCIRGEHNNRGDKIARGFLQVTSSDSGAARIAAGQSGRRELADWIASPQHPLTARVIVNRVWSHLLGEGLVRSVDNFGKLGQRPTHPQLLDHLAMRFVTPADSRTPLGATGLGWSIKALIREIVTSQVYRQSSRHEESAWRVDPENRLLWKANRRRIPAESVRDAMLAISGRLELSPGGSPVEGLGTLVKNNQPDAGEYEQQQSVRRSLYLPIIRNELPAILTVFDFADPDLVVGKRPVTNVPAQALFLMNSPFVMASARLTAERLADGTASSAAQIVEDAWLKVLARRPTGAEVKQALRFLDVDGTEQVGGKAAFRERLARFTHVLFASTEFRMLN